MQLVYPNLETTGEGIRVRISFILGGQAMIELPETVFETDYELRELMLEVPKSDHVETGTMAVFHNASIRLIRVIVEV